MIPYKTVTGAGVNPDNEKRNHYHIFLDLAAVCGVNIFGYHFIPAVLSLSRKMGKRGGIYKLLLLITERACSMKFRVSGQRWRKSLKHHHGRLRASHGVYP